MATLASLQIQFLDGLRPHLELLNFAGDCRGESIFEENVARDFVVGDLK